MSLTNLDEVLVDHRLGEIWVAADAVGKAVFEPPMWLTFAVAAELAGTMGAKRTSDLIPLCHPLPLSSVEVRIHPDAAKACLRIEATARTVGRTGVEMEAMTAASVAALTLYDMVKAVDRDAQIDAVRLEEKSGGKSGHWKR